MIWRSQIYNVFHEIFKFRGFFFLLLNDFMKFAKSIIANIFAIFKYHSKQTIYSNSLDYVLQNHTQHV